MATTAGIRPWTEKLRFIRGFCFRKKKSRKKIIRRDHSLRPAPPKLIHCSRASMSFPASHSRNDEAASTLPYVNASLQQTMVMDVTAHMAFLFKADAGERTKRVEVGSVG